jgi:hypothetical protein
MTYLVLAVGLALAFSFGFLLGDRRGVNQANVILDETTACSSKRSATARGRLSRARRSGGRCCTDATAKLSLALPGCFGGRAAIQVRERHRDPERWYQLCGLMILSPY